ncbi:MAG: GDSL-type esterase/lipase family protein [Lachnospiraceae bacterium]|nr:GDSL-type esterase/lipase family protein [Lachnospiraceae bacterium]
MPPTISAPQNTSFGFADAGTPDVSLVDPSGNPLQVVIFGDSQFDRDRTPSGIAAQLAEATHTIVYNAAIGATTAACLDRSQPTVPPEGSSVKPPVNPSVKPPAAPSPEPPRPGNPYRDPGLLGHVFSAVGLTTPEEAFPGHWSALVMEHCPMQETDVFVLEYGINDFNARVPLLDASAASYGEALSEGIHLLKSAFPNAKILLCGPGYCQFYDTDRNLVGDSDTLSNGLFPVSDYCTVARQVAANYGIAYFDAYEALSINSQNADIYLEPDGVHYTAAGRSLYASKLSSALLEAVGASPAPADGLPPASNQARASSDSASQAERTAP